MTEAEQWTTILGAGIALVVAAGVLLTVVLVVIRLIRDLGRGAPVLQPLARVPIPVGVPHRMTYAADGRPHALWLAIEARWPGGHAWHLAVDLRVAGAGAPIAAAFPIGEETNDHSIDSPLVTGITAIGTHGHYGILGSHITTTRKLCAIAPSMPATPIVVDLAVQPGIRFEALTLALVAAPDPALPRLPRGLG